MTRKQLTDELRSSRLKASHAEEGLRACEKRYRDMFDQSSVCIWDEDWSAVKAMLDDLAGQGVTDFRGYFRDHPDALDALYELPLTNLVSRGVIDIYGAPCAEMLLDRWCDLATEEEHNGFLGTALSFMAGDMDFEYEAEERKLDGTPVIIYTRATVLPDKVHDWSRVIVSTRDITARRTAEKAQRESEACLRSYFDNSPTAISLKDLDGRFMLINREFEKALGRTNEEVRGKTTRDVYPQAVADTVAAREREVVETGEAIEWEQELIDDDGANCWLLVKFPVRDAAGHIISIGSVATNITESKNAERALLESEARLSAFVNHSPAAISLKDSEGRYFLLNPTYEGIAGKTSEQVRGLRSHDIFDSQFADSGVAHDGAVFDAGRAIEREEQVMIEGGLHTFLTLKFPLRDAAGNINGIGGISTDISALKEAERVCRDAREAAELANRSKSEFLANMSHELRTPLNAIIGFSDIMRNQMLGPVGNPRYLSYAKDIHSSGEHLLDLINDILDISKIEAGKIELIEEPIDVDKAVDSCLTMVRVRANQGHVEILRDLAAKLPDMYADERKFKQILINLLSNAIKFTPSGGSVAIRAWSRPGDGYVFQVVDTGIGIALADIPKALAPFQQIDGALNRKYEGAGLGLPLTKALVELHGGSLGLESEVGVGTTVTVRFPKERVIAEELTGTL